MTIFQKISFGIFVAFVAFAVVFSYLINAQYIKQSYKPWHMQPFIDADLLTAEYTDNYELLYRGQLLKRFVDSSRINVVILIDAWGVPFEPQLLREDFDTFRGVPHKEYLHQRLANRTRHAEFAELRVYGDSATPRNGIYLFGGDSLEYGRNLYVDSLGYSQKVFCQKCTDSVMAATLDSVLAVVSDDSANSMKHLAWTTQDSRDGGRTELHATLRCIADIARKHPEVRFIVQGTHRPTLGDPKIRRESFTHWVPAVVIN